MSINGTRLTATQPPGTNTRVATMVASGGAADETSEDAFRDQNTELFRRRNELLLQLADLADNDDAMTQRRAARIRRRLDDVTSEIVTFNMGLVRSYCRRFSGGSRNAQVEDFEAAGMLGLMRAIDSFDPDQGRFGHWAFKPIQREVLRAVRDADHANVNLGDFERRPDILRAQRELQGNNTDANPSYEEIASSVGATVDQVRRVLSPPRFESVAQPLNADGTTLGDMVESDAPSPDTVVIAGMTLSALKRYGFAVLDERERYVLVRRFGLDGEPEEKLVDIGRTLALSREAVRQIETKAIAKIQHPLVLRRVQVDRAS